jgi:hypothetical protein
MSIANRLIKYIEMTHMFQTDKQHIIKHIQRIEEATFIELEKTREDAFCKGYVEGRTNQYSITEAYDNYLLALDTGENDMNRNQEHLNKG